MIFNDIRAKSKLVKRLCSRIFATPKRSLMVLAFSCILVLGSFCLYFTLVNVHVSKLYVKYQSTLYPANITIRPKCIWDGKIPFDFKDFRPYPFVTIAKMLHVAYKQLGIIPILKHGTFLYTFRRIQADDDMDVYLIVPKELTLSMAYGQLQTLTRSFPEFNNITFRVLNSYLSGLVLDKSDGAVILFNDDLIADVNILHETFLNDPALQAPCIVDRMDCKPFSEIDIPYIQEHKTELSTANMFQSLCECQYMDAVLVCFNDNGALYLEANYGVNFKQKRDEPMHYRLTYDRPRRYLAKLVYNYPQLMNFRYFFKFLYFGNAGN